jgi:glycosyltransferase involved in cell wall biosynthesis
VPVYNEEGSLSVLLQEILKNASALKANETIADFEVWFVSDGSTDRSEAIITKLAEQSSAIHFIFFRKNFGKAAALQAGFRHCTGDLIITMDADLQDDPSEFTAMIEKIDEGYDLVSGWKKERRDPLEKRVPSKLFNRFTSAVSGVSLHDFNCGFKIYRREVVQNLSIYGELHRYIPVMVSRKGFRITEIPVHHRKREHGKSKYGAERYLRGFFDSLTTAFLSKYYDRPMYFFGRVGLLSLSLGLVICIYLTILWILGNAIGTRPLLAFGIAAMFIGIQFFSIGLIGDMVVDSTFKNTYDESHIREIK